MKTVGMFVAEPPSTQECLGDFICVPGGSYKVSAKTNWNLQWFGCVNVDIKCCVLVFGSMAWCDEQISGEIDHDVTIFRVSNVVILKIPIEEVERGCIIDVILGGGQLQMEMSKVHFEGSDVALMEQ